MKLYKFISIILSFIYCISCGKKEERTKVLEIKLSEVIPQVISIVPNNNAKSVATNADIKINFNIDMDISSITANKVDSICLGTIQLSKDEFSTCISMKEEPKYYKSLKVYSVTPNDVLDANQLYKVKISKVGKSKYETQMEEDYEFSFTTKYIYGGTVQDTVLEHGYYTTNYFLAKNFLRKL